MTEETKRAAEIDAAVKKSDAAKAAADARARKDAEEEASAGEKIDRLLECLDSISKRMDSMEAERADAAKKATDASEDDDDEEKREKGEPKKLGADARADSIKLDAENEEIEAFKRETGSQHARADSVLADIQSRADRASSAWSKSARAPMDGERIGPYRRRVAREHQEHSANWRDVDLGQLHGQSLRVAADQIFADSYAASRAPESYGDCLREVVRKGPLGHTIREFYGKPSAWLDQFRGGPRRYARFDMALIKKSMGG